MCSPIVYLYYYYCTFIYLYVGFPFLYACSFICASAGPCVPYMDRQKLFLKFEKSLYCFEILFNQTLIKSLGGTTILSFKEVFNSFSICFVYLVLFYKPFQTFIIVLLVQYRYAVTIQHPVRLIVDWFFRRCIYIYREWMQSSGLGRWT